MHRSFIILATVATALSMPLSYSGHQSRGVAATTVTLPAPVLIEVTRRQSEDEDLEGAGSPFDDITRRQVDEDLEQAGSPFEDVTSREE